MMIEISPRCFTYSHPISGEICVLVKDCLSEEVIDYIANNPFDELSLSYGSWQDVNRLVEFKDKISQLQIGSDDIDWHSVSKLSNLERVHIDIGARGKCDLEFNQLVNLKHLHTDWCKGFELTLKNLNKLKSLVIDGYKGKNLKTFNEMEELEFIELRGTRELQSLNGIDKFKKLRYLELDNCSKLEDVSGVIELPKLESIWLDKCKTENDYSILGNLKSINEMFIGGALKDLNWIKNIKTLTLLRLDCKLEDGGLDFLYDMPNLKFVTFNNKRNFSVKLKEIQNYLESKGHNQEELKMEGLTFDEAFNKE